MKKDKGFALWITGFSGAGKSTVAEIVINTLRHDHLLNPIHIDGDIMRSILAGNYGYDKGSREYLASTYGRLCREMTLQGHDIVCSTISMFQHVRNWNRENIDLYTECYLRVPLEELKVRNTKGLYRQDGTEMNVVGADMILEEPVGSDIIIDNHSGVSPQMAAEMIVAHLVEKGRVKCQR